MANGMMRTILDPKVKQMVTAGKIPELQIGGRDAFDTLSFKLRYYNVEALVDFIRLLLRNSMSCQHIIVKACTGLKSLYMYPATLLSGRACGVHRQSDLATSST